MTPNTGVKVEFCFMATSAGYHREHTDVGRASIGEVIGGFRLERLLGVGTKAEVFAATHTQTGRSAAVKVMRLAPINDRRSLTLFQEELRQISYAHHPNIVEIIDVIETEHPKRIACIMELFTQPTLQTLLLGDHAAAPEQALNICLQLTDALRAVHRFGIVHRDVRTSNVVILGTLHSDLSVVPSVKLLEIGVGAAVHTPNGSPASHHNGVTKRISTIEYMAPEQISGGQVSAKTDVYGAGAVLYELLSSRSAFHGAPAEILMQKILDGSRTIRLPEIPQSERIRTIIESCLASDPDKRPSDDELWLELRGSLDDLASPARRDFSWATPGGQWSIGVDRLTPTPTPTPGEVPGSDWSVGVTAVLKQEELTSMPMVDLDHDLETSLSPSESAPELVPLPASAILSTDLPPVGLEHRSRGRLLLIGGVLVIAIGLTIASKLLDLVPAPVREVANRVLPGGNKTQPEASSSAPDHPYRAALEEWKKHAPHPGQDPSQLLEAARQHRYADTWKEYSVANELLEQALVLEPRSGLAIAIHADNLALWKGEMLSEDDVAWLRAGLDFAATLSPKEGAIPRARAALALAKGDLVACQTFASEALKSDPEDGEAKLLLAAAHASGQPERSAEEADEAISVLPQLRRRDLVAARALANGGHYRAAFEVLRGRTANDPRNAAVLKLTADLQRELGHASMAEALYRQATSAEGDRNAARLALGSLLIIRSDLAGASEVFRAAALDREAPPHYRSSAYVGWARATFDRGRIDEAGPPLDAALALADHDAAARLIQAEILLEGGGFERAETIAKDILSAQAGEPAALVILGRAAQARGAPDEAVRFLRDALLSDPHDADIRIVLGGLYLGVGATAPAFAFALDAARLDPRERTDETRKALFHVSPIAVSRAITSFQNVAKDEGSREGAEAALALYYYQHGQRKSASTAIAEVLKLNSSNPFALLYQAEIDLEDGSLGRAEQAFSRLMKREHYSAVAHLGRARVYAKRGMFGEARVEYGYAAKIDASLGLVPFERALAELKHGDAKARERLTSMLVPSVSGAREMLFEANY